MPFKVFDKLFFFGAMSLGDSFVYNGIAHYFADRSIELHLPVVPQWENTLSTLYQDYSNIIIAPIEKYPEEENSYILENGLSRLLRIPVYGININSTQVSPLWDIQLYHFLELPYSLRYSNFRLPKQNTESDELYAKLVTPGEYYVLTSAGRGDIPNTFYIEINQVRANYKLPQNVKIISIDGLADNMLHYVKLIQNAAEIHCVPSAFYCLVENMHNLTNARLFYHANRVNALLNVSSIWNNYRWTIIEYARKL